MTVSGLTSTVTDIPPLDPAQPTADFLRFRPGPSEIYAWWRESTTYGFTPYVAGVASTFEDPAARGVLLNLSDDPAAPTDYLRQVPPVRQNPNLGTF